MERPTNQRVVRSNWRQVGKTRRHRPFPLDELHPDTARALGLKDGDWAWIENHLGQVILRMVVFDHIKSDVVHADGQWWYPEMESCDPSLLGVWLSNIDLILDDDPARSSEIFGTWTLKQTRGRVYKADTNEDWRLVAAFEWLCLEGGTTTLNLSPEDRDIIRRYSANAMSPPFPDVLEANGARDLNFRAVLKWWILKSGHY